MSNENIEGVQGETPLEQSHEKTPEQVQYEHERSAFETHINTSEEKVPDNFKDAGAWFDSLKESQKNFTQARQEISDLQAQLEKKPEPVVEPLTDQLRIPPKEETPAEPVAGSSGVDEATYDMWSIEFATNGKFSDETRNEIKAKTGFSDKMLNDYVEAQQAKLREGYRQAGDVVGGHENLDRIFKWASNNLSEAEMHDVNLGLSSPSYEITLRGLESMYNKAVQSEKAKEPAANPNLTQVAASQTGVLPYKNQREFKAERNDPKFQLEPNYRDMVQKRMAMTDWNTLPK